MDLGWIIDESVQDSKTKKGKISKRPISEEDVEMDDAASHVQNRRDLLKVRSPSHSSESQLTMLFA